MNKHNFIQTGGFPLKAERLQEAEKAYTIFNTLGEIAGNKAIISGCEVVGGTTTDGIVYLNGELYEFRGGNTQSTVRIIQEPISRAFKNGVIKEVYYERYVTFASGTGSIPWEDFSRPFSLLSITERVTELEKQNAVFQADGAMVLWNKPANEIPDGWQEVTDWRGRMPVGWNPNDNDFNTLGEQGGQKNKTLNVNEMPSHKHSFSNTAGSSTGGGAVTTGNATEGPGSFYMEETGGGQSFSIMNPYRVVMFIEYVGN